MKFLLTKKRFRVKRKTNKTMISLDCQNKQSQDRPQSQSFLRLFTDSYSRYFNTKYKRRGSLCAGRFKAIRVESDSQLLHLSRYIHLNPYSSFLIKDFGGLLAYPFSSLTEYLGFSENNICYKEIVLNQFSSHKEYKDFIFDRADYQRALEEIKHQILEG